MLWFVSLVYLSAWSIFFHGLILPNFCFIDCLYSLLHKKTIPICSFTEYNQLYVVLYCHALLTVSGVSYGKSFILSFLLSPKFVVYLNSASFFAKFLSRVQTSNFSLNNTSLI